MNRHDDRFSRGRRSEYERDDWRERSRQGREGTGESFYPGNYGFEEGEYSGRTAGGPEEQPFSRNPYGYYPGQSAARERSGEDWRDRNRGMDERYGSQRFGQREPYNAGGEYSRRGPWRSEGRDDDYGRSGPGGSRYSESQYSTRSGRGDYGERYGSDYQPERGDWRRRGESREYGLERYGMGTDARYGEERGFGEGPFASTTESPNYFGTGYYGDGGASPTGGFDQRTRRRNYGSLGEDMFSSDRDWQGWNRWTGRGGVSERRYRQGPKGYARSDERLREDICERLMLADSVDSSEVTVNVKDGQVTLEGTVPNRRMKHTIEDLVDAAPGVQDIENRLRVERGESQYGSSSGTTSATTSGTGTTMSGGSTSQRTGTTQGATSGAGTTQSASTTGQRRKE